MNTRENELIDLTRKAGRRAFFHIHPRYTGGSGAMVNLGVCAHAAAEEEEFYHIALTGVWGEEKKKLAETKGLAGIAYARWEKGRKVWRLDLLTGAIFEEPKRLEWRDLERLKDLDNRKQHVGLAPDLDRELTGLLHRAEIHRQTLNLTQMTVR